MNLFKKFLSIGLAAACVSSTALSATNYEYGLTVFRPDLNDLSPAMTLDQIIASSTVSSELKTAILKSIYQSQAGLIRSILLNPSGLANFSQANLVVEVKKSLMQFRMALAQNLKNVRISQETEFQIQVSPIISPLLAARRAEQPVTAQIMYPTDRVTLVELSQSVSEMLAPKQEMLNKIYQGIAARLSNAYRAGPVVNPFFVSLNLTLKLVPVVENSTIIAQAVVGMPVNGSKPFTEGDDTIKFKTIQFPKFDSNTLGMTTDAMPTALLTIEQPLNAAHDGKLLIEFGPIGSYRDGLWVRPTDRKNYQAYTPQLIATPAKYVNNIVDIGFNIYNLTADLENQGVSEIDVYLSAGLSAIPKVKIGFINRPDIDNQFKTEINRNLKIIIAEQEAKLKKDGLGKVSTETGMSPQMVQNLLAQLFTIAKK